MLSRQASRAGGFSFVTYTVRLSTQTERGMYDLARQKRTGATRARKRGFVVPSQDEWIKAAYYDPSGGGTLSYWKYPTNAGVFGDGTATAPASTTLDPQNGDVTNAATQPLANYKPSGGTAPNWCPSQVSATDCQTVNPFGLDPTAYATAYQGSLSSVGQAATRSPWGTLDQGGNAVEWTDTITAPPFGIRGGPRVWRRAARRGAKLNRVPDVALRRRPPASGQHVLRAHLPVAGLPDRIHRLRASGLGRSARVSPAAAKPCTGGPGQPPGQGA